MEDKIAKRLLVWICLVAFVVVAIGGLVYYGFTKISVLSEEISSLESKLATQDADFLVEVEKTNQSLAELRLKTSGLSSTLTSTQQNIDAVRTQVGGVEQTVGSISGTVGTLQKLSQIDPELLIKYSKVYFLNENYKPTHLTEIPKDYLYREDESEQFLTEAWPYLKALMDTAKSNGIDLYVSSAYRSFAEQQSLKSQYKVVYGAGTANTFSADQGYSEHQLGTTVDFITTGLGGSLDGFGGTNAYNWLISNAHRFGFELSYPKGNDYYVYEPWHWRFVGVKLSTDLHNNNKSFYDLDQREIDAYTVNIFD